MKNRKLGLIFIITNILILLGIIGFYAYRLVYFYRIENPKIETKNLYKLLTLEKNIVKYDDGLYKLDNKYIYKGNISNNYIRYSGLLFRVYEINENEIKIVSEDTLTVLSKNKNLNDSELVEWTNNLLDGFNKKEEYLNQIDYCYNDDCNKYYFSLPTKEEYDNSVGLLNNNTNYWLLDDSYENNLIVSKDGDVTLEVNKYSGIRITLSLKKNIKILSGDGTKDNPYIFEKSYNNLLSAKYLGEYVKYNDEIYRIIEKDEESIKLISTKILEQEYSLTTFNSSSDLYKYLNNDLYSTLENNSNLIESNYYNGNYDNGYKDVYDKHVTAKIGIPKVGDMFISDFDNTLLLNKSTYYTNTIYIYNNYNYFADKNTNKYKVRLVISLNPNLFIDSGNGSLNNPYILEGEI